MLLEAASLGDGVSFARSVRTVASKARDALNHPARPGEIHELLREIGRLEREARACPSEDLSLWLSNLRESVEVHAARSA